MIAHARDAVLLIDGSKLESRGLIAIAPLSEITLVLATAITPEQAAAARALRHQRADRRGPRRDPGRTAAAGS